MKSVQLLRHMHPITRLIQLLWKRKTYIVSSSSAVSKYSKRTKHRTWASVHSSRQWLWYL